MNQKLREQLCKMSRTMSPLENKGGTMRWKIYSFVLRMDPVDLMQIRQPFETAKHVLFRCNFFFGCSSKKYKNTLSRLWRHVWGDIKMEIHGQRQGFYAPWDCYLGLTNFKLWKAHSFSAIPKPSSANTIGYILECNGMYLFFGHADLPLKILEFRELQD